MDGQLARPERARLLQPLIVGSAQEATDRGQSLALIRPRNTRFISKKKSQKSIDEEREAFEMAARQTSMFDEELAGLEPSPFEFRFRFEDDGGKHDYQNGDWEAHAMFWRERNRKSEVEALKWMSEVFNSVYPSKGMAFCHWESSKTTSNVATSWCYSIG